MGATLDMLFERLCESCIDQYAEQFSGTPEELGALLAVATMRPAQRGWYSDDYCRQTRLERKAARAELESLPDGPALLEVAERIERRDMYTGAA